jgi:lambda family phage portal protein
LNRTYRLSTLNENWIDKFYRHIAPVKAAERLKARMTLALAGSYVGASRQRRSLSHYAPSSGDADSDLLWDLPTLRERSRDLIRNNPLALGALNTVCTSVVGTGLKLQSRIDRDFLQLSDEEADQLESTIEREFRLWANSTYCDVTQTLNFASLQQLVFRSVLENGDCLVLLLYAQSHIDSPYQLALQIIEADRLCNVNHAQDSATLIAGVQKNAVGMPIAYHILKTHPGNLYGKLTNEWFIVPTFNEQTGLKQVLHLYQPLRPGQSRGVPYLAPVIEALKQLGSYTEAEITAAAVSSCFTVFIKTPQGDSELLSKNSSHYATNNDDYKLGNGAIIDLAEGEDISTVNPGRPNAQFDPFVQSVLRQIGVALELPFEILIKHFTARRSSFPSNNLPNQH